MMIQPPHLDPDDLYKAALPNNSGNRAWSLAKEEFAKGLVDFSRRAPRMQLIDLSLKGDFEAVYKIDGPVPVTPDGDRLRILSSAVYHLRYESSWRWEPFPGWAPVSLMFPRDPFAPNMAPALGGAICLGKLAPGIEVSELVLLGYYATSLQNRTLDESDPEGVLNRVACEFFRARPHLLPLTYAGLYEDDWEPAHDWEDAISMTPS